LTVKRDIGDTLGIVSSKLAIIGFVLLEYRTVVNFENLNKLLYYHTLVYNMWYMALRYMALRYMVVAERVVERVVERHIRRRGEPVAHVLVFPVHQSVLEAFLMKFSLC
jgi:hypothetical protein